MNERALPAVVSNVPILVVDDDPMVLNALEITISSAGYRVIATGDPSAGLEYLRKDTFSVIIADQRMDVMSGLELLDHARLLQPDAARILITGLASVKTLSEAVNRGEIYRFIGKPWSTPELLATVLNGVQRYQLVKENAVLQGSTMRDNEALRAANRQLESRVAELRANNADLEAQLAGLHGTRQHLLGFCEAVLQAFEPALAARTRHVAECCRSLAEAANLAPEFREQLLAAAWFHDLGLVALPVTAVRESLQNRINPHDETGASFRKHPEISARLAAAAGLETEVCSAVRAHHESFDGSGFPAGLRGSEIPALARWLTPVAFFVGCGLSREHAAEEIQRLGGRAFDASVIPWLLRVALKLPSPEAIAREAASTRQSNFVRKSYVLS